MTEEGFFCEKCGTVYIAKIMACSTCQPKIYEKLADDFIEKTNALLYARDPQKLLAEEIDETETAQEAGDQAGETSD